MRSFTSQFRTVTPVLLISWLVTLLSLLLAIFIATRKDVPLDTLTKDPTAIMGAPFYLGFFSNLSVVIWSCAFAITIFAVYRIRQFRSLRESYFFLLFSAFITLLMTMDDLYQLHEFVLPHYLYVPENAVLLTYFNIYLIYGIRFRKQLEQTDFVVLALSFGFLGLSTAIKLLPLPIPQDTFLKDGFKLFGAVTWLIYYFRTSNEILERT